MKTFHPQRRRRPKAAFTLVEIMVVVVIIGLLAALAIPALQRAQSAAKTSRFISDLRTFVQSFEQYALENGTWPPNVGSGAVPANMTTALHIAVWTSRNTLGGRWNWDRNYAGNSAAVSTVGGTLTDAEMEDIDAQIDDGDLSTGIFQKSASDRFSYIVEQ